MLSCSSNVSEKVEVTFEIIFYAAVIIYFVQRYIQYTILNSKAENDILTSFLRLHTL